MNGNTVMIGLVVVLIVSTGGILVLYDVTDNMRQSGRQVNSQQQAESSDELIVTNVIGTEIQDDGMKYVRIQVRYEGEGELNLNDTFIQLRTDKSITDLQYRNGTTNRSITDGFYTQ